MHRNNETQADATRVSKCALGRDGWPQARTTRRGKVIAATCAIATAAIVATGCAAGHPETSGPPEERNADVPAPPAAAGCIEAHGTVDAGRWWLEQRPPARAFSRDPIPFEVHITGEGKPGDEVRADQAILDFAPAPREAGRAIVLISLTVKLTEPTPWEAARELMLVAYQRSPGNPASLAPRCALTDPGVLAAMRDTGHTPLPERITAGSQVSGWVAFAVPRGDTETDTEALTLSMYRGQADGSSTGTARTLMRTDGHDSRSARGPARCWATRADPSRA